MQRVVDAVPSGRVRETVVVVGHDARAVAQAISERKGVTTVFNPAYRDGMAGSIRVGVEALARGTDGALILLGDQPFVTRSLLVRMLKAFDQGGPNAIVAATHGGITTPPVIFASCYFEELERLRGDQGARSVVERHIEATTLVEAEPKEVFDVDTRRDIERAGRLEP